ncbi:hypothetical protein FRAAL6824 [Frankia alni ACN14a]|uniref:Uncharacterized protein n=1 Tax=Frankia alni (strain DSM 45986 / CECT 9034 / ACN14a) TaxID=326424 RepID=Q0RAU3_FRAAA|nr:hypothetical protein FRAAL6824 [Frankia alni ACN14a]
MTNEERGADAIRIAGAALQPARLPQAPDWKVVPGHAYAVPASPPVLGGHADTESRR